MVEVIEGLEVAFRPQPDRVSLILVVDKDPMVSGRRMAG